jgi:uncharacterized membrane protein YuzA (DUF378 family)
MSEISFPPPAPHRQQEAHAAAQRWVRKLRILYTVVGVYAVLSLMWFAIDMADGTENIWFYWPMLGTGVVVAVISVVLVGIGGLFGVDWERRRVDRYLRAHSSPTVD